MTNPAARRGRVIERGWGREASPFHAGEQQVQSRVGVRAQVEHAGRNMIHEQLPEPHRELFEALPLLVVGSLDTQGRVWASLLSGEPGFVRSPTAKLLTVQAQPALGDPLAQQLVLGAPLGLLGIQLQTRRRNRANGRIVGRDATSFSVEVEQSFGNCKQYIWEGPELESFEGAERLLSFEVSSGKLLERALPLRFHGLTPSPDLLETGTWSEAERNPANH